MALPPLSERSTAVLQEKLERLRQTYNTCAEIFSPNITPNAAKALDRINDAIGAIGAELQSRAARGRV